MPDSPCNTWEQVGLGGIFITSYSTLGRNPTFAGWEVFRRGFDINQRPKAERAWYEDVGQRFSAFECARQAALAAAQRWAGERYNITKWKRNGMHDYIDANAGLAPLRREVEQKAARAAKRALREKA